jgi:uncharacterized iron-regulated membrane protein
MKFTRLLILDHRYLGIAIGLVMVMWCLSGIVMMYMRYPELSEPRRLAALQPLDFTGCCKTGLLETDQPVSRLNIEMLAGRPVMRVVQGNSPPRLADLTDGKLITHISAEQADAVARTYGQSAAVPTAIERDQWTVAGGFRRDRPLYRFALDDPERTQLYISSTTGKAVQITTETQRFWNWLGAIPHWLYFTRLRADVALWSQVVIWISLLGCFLAGTGLYLGIRRYHKSPDARWSPYRGFMLWHHLPGLVFGLFVLTWAASGLISMNPWGFLDSTRPATEEARLRGSIPSGADITAALPALADALPPGTVSLKTAPFDGQLAFIASTADGRHMRVDGSGKPMPSPDMARVAALLNGGPATLMTTGDAYYFDSRSDPARLPAYRVTAGSTRYYLDPLSGELLKTVDENGRWYRWLHEGLHRLDFSAVLRQRPLWDLVMLTLMLGVTFVCGTGAYLGLRRLKRRL